MKCPNCSHENEDSLDACARCGATLIDPDQETAFDVPSPAGSEDGDTYRSPPTEIGGSAGETAAPEGELATEFLSREEITSATGRAAQSTPGSGSYPRSSTGQLLENAVFAGRYQIMDILGEGGMGVVYKARDLELDKLIALKTIRSERETDPEIVQRFKRELLLAREITHKNVVRIHDFGEADDIKYFTMAFIEGQSLKGLIRQKKRLSAEETVPIVKQILSALQEAHDQGVIHRDLKPQNIMIDLDGVPHIMDFGIARSAVETTDLTATGMMIGTPDYMSPEQVKGEKATGQSDIFSFGVILYEMATGDLPYKADSPASKVMMRLSHKPKAPRQISLEIPKYLEQIIQKCMEVDPTFRYKSANDALEDIERQFVDRSLTLKVQKAVGKSTPKILAVAALMAAVGAGVYYTTRPAADSPTVASDDASLPITTLAILPFTNATGAADNEWMRSGIPEMLVHDIGQSNYVRPVPSERVLRAMGELGVEDNTRFDEPTLNSLAARIPADTLLYGQFVESGGNLRLDLTVRKTGTGVPTPINAEMASTDVFAIVDELTQSVKQQLDLTEDEIRGDVDRPVTEVSTSSLEALRSYQRGLDEITRGNNQEAGRLLQIATLEDPQFAMAYTKLAEAQFAIGEHVEAEAAVDRARRLAAERPLPVAERYQIHATAGLVEGDYDVAAESLAELARLYPEDPDIHLSLARSYEELAHLGEARTAYERVVEIAPDYGAALLGLGRVLDMGGDSEGAIRILKQALETGQFDDDPEALGMLQSILGVAHREIGELDTALIHLELSLEARTESGNDGGRAITLINMSGVHLNKGDVDEAVRLNRQAIQIARDMRNPKMESGALTNLGMTFQLAGRLDESLQAFRDSLRIEMDSQDELDLANKLDHIANIYRLMGRYDDAVVYLERAQGYLEKIDDDLERSINLGHLAAVRKAQGLYPEAVTAFIEGIAISSEIHDLVGVSIMHQNLADIYAMQGRYADAFSSLEQSVEIAAELHNEHDIAEVKAPLGQLMIHVGLLDNAEAELEEAEHVAHGAEAQDLLPSVYLGRARLYDLRGQQDEAAEAYEEANVRANLSGQKEVAVASRIALGKLFLAQDKLPNAERMLERTRAEAADARLRPLVAEAAVALANVYLVQGDAAKARETALEAISIADDFDGRPILMQAYETVGHSLEALGRSEESIDAHARSAEILEWIRGSLRPEHVRSYVSRPDIHELVQTTASALESGGRTEQAATLKSWLDSEE